MSFSAYRDYGIRLLVLTEVLWVDTKIGWDVQEILGRGWLPWRMMGSGLQRLQTRCSPRSKGRGGQMVGWEAGEGGTEFRQQCSSKGTLARVEQFLSQGQLEGSWSCRWWREQPRRGVAGSSVSLLPAAGGLSCVFPWPCVDIGILCWILEPTDLWTSMPADTRKMPKLHLISYWQILR